VGLSPNTSQPIKIRTGCNISQLRRLVNILRGGNHRRGKRPISTRARLRRAWFFHPPTQVFAFRVCVCNSLGLCFPDRDLIPNKAMNIVF
ncbi:MAG: hypothetical protein ABIP88_14050, partial [Candidatus Binatia bacterium]